MSDTVNANGSVSSQALVEGEGSALEWRRGAEFFAIADTYWLATTRPDGRPHVVPVLAVWAEDMMHFAAGPATRKAHNLSEDARCVLSAKSGGFDLVLEGTAERVIDEAALNRIADAYDTKYGWRVTVRDGAFQDTEGAPTAGPPPFDIYAIIPGVAFAFGTDEQSMATATRWRFSA